MKNNKIIVLTLCMLAFILIIIPFYNIVYAETLKLDITSDQEEIKSGEEIKIKVTWNKEMQAADYYLKYDAGKLEYIKSDIDDVFINNDSIEGKIKTAWFSMDNSKKTSIEYIFKIKNNGQLKFTTSINGGFATENMEVPDEYSEGELIIGTQENYNIIYIITAVLVISFILFIFINRRKK